MLFALGKLQQLHFILVIQKLLALTKQNLFLKNMHLWSKMQIMVQVVVLVFLYIVAGSVYEGRYKKDDRPSS